MGTPDEFLDTNILVYAFSVDPRSTAAEALLAGGHAISVQGLNEFANVARRKLGMNWDEINEALEIIRSLCSFVAAIDEATHRLAMSIASDHGFSVFDAVMIASALQAGCRTLWSEDMQDGRLIEGKLRIRNPFI